jgi:hypothetical protein
MSLAKCLDELVKAGALSREQAEDTLTDVKRQTKKNAEFMAMGDAERAASEAVLAKKMAEAKRSREQLAMQVVKQKEIDNAAQAHEKGSGWGYQSFLTKDWHGKAQHANVEYRASTLTNLFLKSADVAFERLKPTKLGFVEDRAAQEGFIRALFGEKGDEVSAAMGKAWSGTAEKMREMFNRAGGDIAHLDSWRIPQSHDQIRIREAGFEAWQRDVDQLKVKVFDPEGAPLVGLERMSVLREAYETLSTGGLNKINPGSSGNGKKLANKRGESRVLHFSDAAGWLEYHEKYGRGSIYSILTNHVKSMATDIAALEILGPNPAQMVRYMRDMAKRDGDIGLAKQIERTWEEISGSGGEVGQRHLRAFRLERPYLWHAGRLRS